MPTFYLALLTLGAGALLAPALSHNSRLAHGVGMVSATVGSILGFFSALPLLVSGETQIAAFTWSAAGLQVSLLVDSLAAFFLLPLFLLSFCCALYATHYLLPFTRTGQAGYHWFFFNLLVANMALVLTAAHGLLFLIAWELMSLCSFFLVIYNYEQEEVRRAGLFYLLATHLGTIFVFLFFLLAARESGQLDFSSFSALQQLPEHKAVLLFFLGLLGFSTKAGLFPFHVWLPDVHPVAPSHEAALMSGVMLKIAIYAFLRLTTFLPPLPSWCGLTLVFLGMAGALFAICMAFMQTDLKRVLAFSSVENIGIIFLALGLYMYCTAAGQSVPAALCLAGALLHIWNHGLFKGLLFLGAGALVRATSTRKISAMGGLLRTMPVTGTFFLFGCLAISALPPLNGFISEWFIYMGMLHIGQVSGGATAVLLQTLVALLALAGGLGLITFSRLAGITLLGRPRREQNAGHEAGSFMLAAMALPVTLCLVIGLVPMPIFSALRGPLKIFGGEAALAALAQGSQLQAAGPVLGALLLLSALFFGLRRGAWRGAKRQPTWGCSFLFPTSRMAYTAGGYSQLAQHTILLKQLQPDQSPEAAEELFPKRIRAGSESVDPILRQIFQPLFAAIVTRALTGRKLHTGDLSFYLASIFITTTVLLGLVCGSLLSNYL